MGTVDVVSSNIETYRSLLRQVLEAPVVGSVLSPVSIGSSWGTQARPFREVLGATGTFTGLDLLLSSPSRPVDAEYASASSAWIVLGREDVASVAAFNSRGYAFSSDGSTLCGAFGARLRRGCGARDQLEAAFTLLERDPTTRRASMLIADADDISRQDRDFPCATSVHLLVRDGRLTCSVHMRSQSLFGVFPYDLANFAQVRNYAAWRLGLEPGDVVFTFSSLHVYEEEVPAVRRFLDDQHSRFVPLPELPWDTLAASYDQWVAGIASPPGFRLT